MNAQLDFRALLLRVQDLLSDSDRHRLHFLLGEDVPRCLRDDVTLNGTLRLLDSLLEKTFISDGDCEYLIDAFKKIHCLDAARRLQGSPLSSFVPRRILSDLSASFRVSANSKAEQCSQYLIGKYSTTGQ